MQLTDPRPGPGHERNDVSTRGVVRFLVTLAVSASALPAAVAMTRYPPIVDPAVYVPDVEIAPQPATLAARALLLPSAARRAGSGWCRSPCC